MRVESVEAFPVKIKMDEDLRGGAFAYQHYQTVFARRPGAVAAPTARHKVAG